MSTRDIISMQQRMNSRIINALHSAEPSKTPAEIQHVVEKLNVYRSRSELAMQEFDRMLSQNSREWKQQIDARVRKNVVLRIFNRLCVFRHLNRQSVLDIVKQFELSVLRKAGTYEEYTERTDSVVDSLEGHLKWQWEKEISKDTWLAYPMTQNFRIERALIGRRKCITLEDGSIIRFAGQDLAFVAEGNVIVSHTSSLEISSGDQSTTFAVRCRLVQ